MSEAELAHGNTKLELADTSDRADVEALQFAAYAFNRELLGVEPQPLQTDYARVFEDYEVWISRGEGAAAIEAALILETNRPATHQGDLLIWSVSTAPGCQHKGVGHELLNCAEQRARELGRKTIRLYTGQRLTHLVAWYSRSGYAVERIEELPDRKVVHMIKHLD